MSLPDGIHIETVHRMGRKFHEVRCMLCGWLSRTKWQSGETARQCAEKHAGSTKCQRRQRAVR